MDETTVESAYAYRGIFPTDLTRHQLEK